MHINQAEQVEADWECMLKEALMGSVEDTPENFESAIVRLDAIRELGSEVPHDLMFVARSRQVQLKLSTHQLEKKVESPTTSQYDLRQIAANSNTPPYLLEKLADYKNHQEVPSAVASNPNVPIYILKQFIEQSPNLSIPCWHYVLREVAKNQKTPAYLLERLLQKDENDVNIRCLIANHPNTPHYLVKYLLAKFEADSSNYSVEPKNPYVSDILLEKCLTGAKNLFRTGWHEQHKDAAIRQMKAIAQHPNVPDRILQELLLDHENQMVCYAAAMNPKTPILVHEQWGLAIFDALPAYVSNSILETVAKSPYIPEGLLQKLVKHKEQNIRCAAASNPVTTNEILNYWESSSFYTTGELEQCLVTEQRVLEQWESKIPASSRLVILTSSQTPPGILAKLSRSLNWLERYAIAQNPNTPSSTLKILMNDGNRVVRAAANTTILQHSSTSPQT